MTKKDSRQDDRVIFIDGEPLLQADMAYKEWIADLESRLAGVPSEAAYKDKLNDEQESRRFRRRHLLLSALKSVVHHNVGVEQRSYALQELLFELSQAVRELEYDVKGLDSGYSASLVMSPAPEEAGTPRKESNEEQGRESNQESTSIVPNSSDFISLERKLLLMALALSAVSIPGMTKLQVREQAAKIAGLNADSLDTQESHLTKSIAHFKGHAKAARQSVHSRGLVSVGKEATNIQTPRFKKAEIDLYNRYGSVAQIG